MTTKDQAYDIIIIGAGPSGLTAGIYAAWLGLKTLILESRITGGRANEAVQIKNFPGFPEGISGAELVKRMSAQASGLGAQLVFEEVLDLNLDEALKRITTREVSYCAPALIVATGTQRRKLGVPGEAEFLGRGVSYCAVCDGGFFRGLRVAVVGHGNEAGTDALFLAELAKEVLLIIPEKGSKDEGNLDERVRKKGNIKTINAEVKAILGESAVNAVELADLVAGGETVEEVNGVFVSLDSVPMTQIVKKAGIRVDQNGCITVDRGQRTNREGVFAVGDCTCGGMQVVTAAGEGAMAAMKAAAFLKREKKKTAN